MADDIPRRKPGRPPLDPTDPGGSTQLTLRIPAREFDLLYKQSRAARCSLPEWIRRQLQRSVTRPRQEE